MTEVCEALQLEGGIVVGHDGSKCAQEALAWAGRLARRADVDLHVVRAWAMMSAPRPPSWEPGYVPPLTDWEKAVHDELSAHVAAVGLDATVRVTCHVIHKSPTEGLMSAAEGGHLLVVGARGRGGFRGLLLGSVSDQLVHHAPCPVTVVRTGAMGREIEAGTGSVAPID
jgi:nucleotide-binding universal stress UspA family protein